jgi:hypothetical protein
MHTLICLRDPIKTEAGFEGTTYKNGSGHTGNKSLGMPPGDPILKTTGNRVGFSSCF